VEGKGFRDGIRDFDERGAVILGASFDTVEANAAFATKFSFPFLLLCDTDRKLGLAYGAADDPAQPAPRRISYIIDPEGRVAHAFPRVDTREHAADVLRLLPAKQRP